MRLRLGEAWSAGIVDRRIPSDGIGRSGAGRDVVVAGRQTVHAELAGVVGLIPGPHALQATLPANHARPQHLHARARDRIAELVDHAAMDRAAASQREVGRERSRLRRG